MSKRVILIVLDSAGIGEMPDAAEFGDKGCNTIGHIWQRRPMNIPNMRRYGLGNIQGSLVTPWEGQVELTESAPKPPMPRTLPAGTGRSQDWYRPILLRLILMASPKRSWRRLNRRSAGVLWATV